MKALRVDPTRTGILQRKLARELAKPLWTLYDAAAAYVEGVVVNAGFGDGSFVEQLVKWLKQKATVTLAPVKSILSRWLGLGVRQGAKRAVVDSGRTRPVPAQSQDVVVSVALGTGGSKSRVDLIVARSLNDLQGLSEQAIAGIGRLLAEGMAAGHNPKKVAAAIRKQFGVTKRRAETIARTEMVRAHAEGQLAGFEQMGVTKLGVQAEWLATHDGKACPKCKAMSGKVFTLEQAHGKIPMHPNCRCAWVPYIPVRLKERPRVARR